MQNKIQFLALIDRQYLMDTKRFHYYKKYQHMLHKYEYQMEHYLVLILDFVLVEQRWILISRQFMDPVQFLHIYCGLCVLEYAHYSYSVCQWTAPDQRKLNSCHMTFDCQVFWIWINKTVNFINKFVKLINLISFIHDF